MSETTTMTATESRITDVFGPDLYITGVTALDPTELRSRGIDTLLMDLDNTMLPRDTGEFPQEVLDWVARVREAGITLWVVSNNWHDYARVRAAEIGLPIVVKAVKPIPLGFLIAMRRAGSRRRSCAVVGDQVFTDVLGGKLVGLFTVLVVPQSTSDLPHTLMLRKLERLVLRSRQPLTWSEGGPSGRKDRQ